MSESVWSTLCWDADLNQTSPHEAAAPAPPVHTHSHITGHEYTHFFQASGAVLAPSVPSAPADLTAAQQGDCGGALGQVEALRARLRETLVTTAAASYTAPPAAAYRDAAVAATAAYAHSVQQHQHQYQHQYQTQYQPQMYEQQQQQQHQHQQQQFSTAACCGLSHSAQPQPQPQPPFQSQQPQPQFVTQTVYLPPTAHSTDAKSTAKMVQKARPNSFVFTATVPVPSPSSAESRSTASASVASGSCDSSPCSHSPVAIPVAPVAVSAPSALPSQSPAAATAAATTSSSRGNAVTVSHALHTARETATAFESAQSGYVSSGNTVDAAGYAAQGQSGAAGQSSFVPAESLERRAKCRAQLDEDRLERDPQLHARAAAATARATATAASQTESSSFKSSSSLANAAASKDGGVVGATLARAFTPGQLTALERADPLLQSRVEELLSLRADALTSKDIRENQTLLDQVLFTSHLKRLVQ